MRFQKLAYAALATSGASAQTVNLTGALGSDSSLTSFVSLLGAYPDLVASLSNATNITLLAPSNDALQSILGYSGSNSTNSTASNSTVGALSSFAPGYLQALLSYHVLNGTFYASQVTNASQFVPTLLTNTSYTNVTGGQVVECALSSGNVTFFSGLKNNVSVSQADLNFTGGTIHVIDGILTIPQNLTTTAQDANLTALVGAIQTLNLTSVLDGTPDITVFAPNNSAFQQIGSALANASTEDLTSILEYHVVSGAVDYSSILGTSNSSLMTLSGGNLTITNINGTIYVNSAKVVNPDVLIGNGVVHVIDGVLNPNNTAATANATDTTTTPAFSGATSVSDVPFTSGVTAPTSSNAAAGTATTSASARSSSSSGVAAMPMKTGAVGAAALFGGAAIMANW